MTYSQLITIPLFIDRYKYLSLHGKVGEDTFGYRRYLNQLLYHSKEWQHTRRQIILRDNGFDLAHEDFPINGHIYVHHINPISVEMVMDRDPVIFDPDNLISVSKPTHDAIHYGDISLLPIAPPERLIGDTKLW